MRRFLYQRVPHYCRAPLWMAFAYYSTQRQAAVFVIYPFNFLVCFLWWMQDRWARHTHNPSWIEREVRAREKQYREVVQRRF